MSDGGFLNPDVNVENPVPAETIPEAEAPVVGEMPVEAPPVETMEAPPAEAVPSPEASSVEIDQQTYEALPETRDAFLETPGEQEMVFEQAGAHLQATAPPPAGAIPVQLVKDEVVLEVEKILEEGLGDYYSHMPEDAKARFHQKGEEAAFKIADMVRKLQVKIKQVLLLIRQWLQAIPGVNKFFQEQEAKLKSDRVLQLEEARRKSLSSHP